MNEDLKIFGNVLLIVVIAGGFIYGSQTLINHNQCFVSESGEYYKMLGSSYCGYSGESLNDSSGISCANNVELYDCTRGE